MSSIILYTLQNCPICEMIKTKLSQKNIPYEEKDFSEFAAQYNVEQAPAMIIPNQEPILSPRKMTEWIKSQ